MPLPLSISGRKHETNRPPCLRTHVHLLSGLYTIKGGGDFLSRFNNFPLPLRRGRAGVGVTPYPPQAVHHGALGFLSSHQPLALTPCKTTLSDKRKKAKPDSSGLDPRVKPEDRLRQSMEVRVRVIPWPPKKSAARQAPGVTIGEADGPWQTIETKPFISGWALMPIGPDNADWYYLRLARCFRSSSHRALNYSRFRWLEHRAINMQRTLRL